MQAHRISFKLSFTAGEALELEHFVPVFHAWIRECKLQDEVMIDVADYAHVVDGPGVLLVCHEGHYVIERRAGHRWALAYHRKRGGEGDSLEDRIRVPLKRIVTAARLLEGDSELHERVRFEMNTLELAVRCRLHAPNTPQTRETLMPRLQTVLGPMVGGTDVKLDFIAEDPREPFTVRAQLPTPL